MIAVTNASWHLTVVRTEKRLGQLAGIGLSFGWVQSRVFEAGTDTVCSAAGPPPSRLWRGCCSCHHTAGAALRGAGVILSAARGCEGRGLQVPLWCRPGLCADCTDGCWVLFGVCRLSLLVPGGCTKVQGMREKRPRRVHLSQQQPSGSTEDKTACTCMRGAVCAGSAWSECCR